MSTVENLHRARKNKYDEFYTPLSEIEQEIPNYDLKGKIIYMPCDHYKHSNFWKYFYDNFKELQLKGIIATNYDTGEGAFCAEYDGFDMRVVPLQGDGDFSSLECTKIRNRADVVITNPPFSLFRAFVNWLDRKPFLIIGSKLGFTYRNVIQQVKENRVWSGCRPFTGDMWFETANGDVANISCCWFTNLDHHKRHEVFDSGKAYCDGEYRKYDNSDAIEIPRLKQIPMDYEGIMGVPVTFLYEWNPDQYDIVGYLYGDDGEHLKMDGKEVYFRILIKKPNPTGTVLHCGDGA